MRDGEQKHGADCDCVRCRGFQPGHEWSFGEGNDAAATHGAHSPQRLKPRADRYLDLVRGEHTQLTGDPDSAGIALQRLAHQLARAELIEEWADENGWVRDDGSLQPAVAQLATIDNSIRKMLDALGLTEVSRASLRESLLRGDLIDAALAQAGFRETMIAADQVVVALAGEFLPVKARGRFVAEFRARHVPAAQAAVAALGKQELVAGEIVAETDEPLESGGSS